MKEVRTRFAPSPTGIMHIGGARTALYAFLVAKQKMGKFVLRIEDTDQERYVEGAVEAIYQSLKKLDLIWDEGPDVGGPYKPYIQSERKENYLMWAQKLIEEDKAYFCFCSEDRLQELKIKAQKERVAYKYDGKCRILSKEEVAKNIEAGIKGVIRFKTPRTGETSFNDIVYGNVVVKNIEIEDLILIKSDKMPTYNFANIIDDKEMEITHIIRGNEYISSTPKYVLIYDALGWEIPKFIHLPIIKKSKESDKKLSKRDSDSTVEDLFNKGYLKDAIINMLALTGWSPGDEREIFSLEELIEEFNSTRISKGNAIFDIEKLNWLNSQYMKRLSLEELKELVIPFIKEKYNLENRSDKWLDELISLYRNQLSYGKEIINLIEMFFEEEVKISEEDKQVIDNNEAVTAYDIFSKEISDIKVWNIENIKVAIDNLKQKTTLVGRDLFMPIRIIITGHRSGPELPNTIYLLGKETVLNRLKR